MTHSMTVMIGISIFMLALITFLLMKRFKEGNVYDVMNIFDGKLTVFAIFPVHYDLKDIEEVIFSSYRAKYHYMGRMKIIKKNGEHRSFVFDASALHNRMVLTSSQNEIDLVITKLTKELQAHGIRCGRR